MKKIIISLAVIGVVAAIVIGGTVAYFSDTETSEGNTFSAGTIDISIDDENPWTETYNLGDLKPSETAYINFRINNVGQNPVNISKKLYNIEGNGGIVQEYDCGGNIGMVSSEPECDAERKLEYREDDIQKVITYDLSVEVYTGGGKLLWWQTIYSDAENKSIANVYGENGGNYVNLGMIPVDGYMMVTQSYHLNGEMTTNEYQGDGLTFDIEIKGDQLMQEGGATVTLEDKDGEPDWNIIQGGPQGVLTYQTKGSTFDYSFSGTGLQNISYSLIYYADPWPGNNPGALIASGTASNGSLTLSGSYDFGYDLPNPSDQNAPAGAKIWLVPSSDYNPITNSLTAWNFADYLFETSLITYEDTDL